MKEWKREGEKKERKLETSVFSTVTLTSETETFRLTTYLVNTKKRRIDIVKLTHYDIFW